MKTEGTTFSIDSIELEKVFMVLALRLKFGYSAYEVSFLLGRRDYYVRDTENPLHTLQYSVNENNYLRQIFNCSLKKIMPGRVEPFEYIIKVLTHTNDDDLKVYQIERRFLNGKWKLVHTVTEEPKEILRPLKGQTVSMEDVNAYIVTLFHKGYFEEPKTALIIYRACEKKLGRVIRPLHVANALAAFTGKRKAPRLITKTNESGRMIYWQE